MSTGLFVVNYYRDGYYPPAFIFLKAHNFLQTPDIFL